MNFTRPTERQRLVTPFLPTHHGRRRHPHGVPPAFRSELAGSCYAVPIIAMMSASAALIASAYEASAELTVAESPLRTASVMARR